MTKEDFAAKRCKLGVTQRELGVLLGVSETQVRHLERGRRKVKPYYQLAMYQLIYKAQVAEMREK